MAEQGSAALGSVGLSQKGDLRRDAAHGGADRGIHRRDRAPARRRHHAGRPHVHAEYRPVGTGHGELPGASGGGRLRNPTSTAAWAAARVGAPDLAQVDLHGALHGLRHLVEPVAGLVHPAALVPRARIDFLKSHPEAEGPVAHSQFRCPWPSRAASPRQAVRASSGRSPGRRPPPSRGQALEADEFLAAFRRGADQHRHAGRLALHARLQVDAICPHRRLPRDRGCAHARPGPTRSRSGSAARGRDHAEPSERGRQAAADPAASARNVSASSSTACARSRRAPARNTSLRGSSTLSGSRRRTILVGSVKAYRSVWEVLAGSTPASIRRLQLAVVTQLPA